MPPEMETPPPAERSDSATIAGAIDTQKHTASADLPRGLHWGIATFARERVPSTRGGPGQPNRLRNGIGGSNNTPLPIRALTSPRR